MSALLKHLCALLVCASCWLPARADIIQGTWTNHASLTGPFFNGIDIAVDIFYDSVTHNVSSFNVTSFKLGGVNYLNGDSNHQPFRITLENLSGNERLRLSYRQISVPGFSSNTTFEIFYRFMFFDGVGPSIGPVTTIFSESSVPNSPSSTDNAVFQVPEPGSLALLSLAGAGLLVAVRRERRAPVSA